MNLLPPAIALFSALLKREGHQVALFDTTSYVNDGIDSDGTKMEHLNVAPYDMGKRGIQVRTSDWRADLLLQYRAFRPDLVAISSTEDMWLLGARMLSTLGDDLRSDRVPVIVGGVFATFAPHLVLRHPQVDMVCLGEGEQAMIDLCDRIQRGISWQDVGSLWVKTPDGSTQKNPVSRLIDINENPSIDITLFEESRIYRPMSGRIYKMLPVETIRGCPYKCAYCNSPTQSTFYREQTGERFLRKRRIDLLEKELRDFKDGVGAEYIYFWADTFLAWTAQEFDAFCEMYAGIKLPFWMQTRPETLTEERVRRLADVGLHRISFGIEHGNEAFRIQHLNRRFSNDDIVQRLAWPHRYDVQFSVNNITGFPHETRAMAMDTVELNRRIDADNQNMYAFVPFHGTPMRGECERLGLVEPDTITRCLTDSPMLRMPQYPMEEIAGLQKCFVLYVKFPRSRWDEIRRAEAETPAGHRLYESLKEEFMATYYHPAKDNPHAEYRIPVMPSIS